MFPTAYRPPGDWRQDLSAQLRSLGRNTAEELLEKLPDRKKVLDRVAGQNKTSPERLDRKIADGVSETGDIR